VSAAKPALAMIGLGRMGANMLRRLARAGIPVIGYDASAAAGAALSGEPGVQVAATLAEAVAALSVPRAVWIMLPAGEITDGTVRALAALLSPGDAIMDGGNTDYLDTLRRATQLAAKSLNFIDVGVSGGVWGLENGYGLMFGGPRGAVEPLLPIFRALAPAPDRGWVHCGPTGSGHYAKMVHNGIEYGLMQSYAEGLALLHAKSDFGYDLAAVTEAWRSGTVIRSWLLDLAAGALRQDGALEGIAPVVADSGEGRWSIREALELGVPVPVMASALHARLVSQGRGDFTARILARLRQAFGGHAVSSAGGNPGKR